jgi:hypothetical protein
MGADCHSFFIEQKRYGSGTWWDVARIETGRDYTAFGLLAGVRHGELDHIEPRGYPSDMGWGAENHSKEGSGDCHSETWLTTDEMVECQRRYAIATSGQSYDALAFAIMVMRMAEERHPEKPVRAVFCFDN